MNQTKGFIMKTNNKKPSALKLWLLRVIPTALIGTLTMAASCHREPDPQPEPTKTINISFNWGKGWDNMHMDTIKKYATQSDVKTINLYLENDYSTNSWTPNVFHSVCDSVEKRFKYSDKVKGSGTIFVSRQGGAQLPSVDFPGAGMAELDSIRFKMMGYDIARFYQH